MCVCDKIEESYIGNILLEMPIYFGSSEERKEKIGTIEIIMRQRDKETSKYTLDLGFLYGSYGFDSTQLRIHYCPVCGRKLGKVKGDK